MNKYRVIRRTRGYEENFVYATDEEDAIDQAESVGEWKLINQDVTDWEVESA